MRKILRLRLRMTRLRLRMTRLRLRMTYPVILSCEAAKDLQTLEEKEQNMKRVVITGPTGAIGRALINEALGKDYEVLAIVHRESKRADQLGGIPRCQVLRMDLSEYHNAMDILKEQGIRWEASDALDPETFFFHLAWDASYGEGRNDIHYQMQNVNAALEAVTFAKNLGCSTFVGAGSQAEYGRIEQHAGAELRELRLRPDTPTNPETGYGNAKLCAGHLTRYFAEQEGMRHIWVRVLSVYGPYDREETMISTAVRRMLQKEDTEFSPCEQIWDYLYSEDAARALLLSAEKGVDGKTYVLGSGEAHSLRWYVEQVAEITGYEKEIGFGKRPYNEDQVMHMVADITELSKDTGFVPEFTFDQGIRRLVQRYQINTTF